MRKAILVTFVILTLTACAGQLHPFGSVTVGPQGGTVSGPGDTATVTVPMR